MAKYGEEYMKQEGHHQNNEYAQNPLQSNPVGQGTGTTIHSTTAGHGIGGTGTTVGTGAGHGIGGTGTTVGTGAGHGYEEEKHGGTGGILHRTGSGSSSSSEDDGEGGRRKKKGVVGKIKEKLPGGGDHGAGDEYKTSATHAPVGGGGGVGGYGTEAGEGHEKKGLMDKIKDKLPGGHK